MLNPVTSISQYVKAIGKAYVYVASDPTTATSWQMLGLTEGDIAVEEKAKYNDFKLPEWTGDAVHERFVDGQDVDLKIPLIWGDATLYDTISPTGARGGGRSRPIAVVTYTVLVIPITEVDTGMSYDGTTWVPAAPSQAIWLHRATFEPGSYSFKHADGGKILRTIQVKGMFDDSKPEGQKIWTVGDPTTQGITTYRL